MIRGFYTALSGILSSMSRQAVVADNLANVNTPGFKQSRTASRDFELELYRSTGGHLGQLGSATIPQGPFLDLRQGPIETTGLPTDLAIEGEGMFIVRTADGYGYTRAGNFLVDVDGTLVSQRGEPVMDTTGRPITVPGGAAGLSVGPDGTVAGTGRQIAVAALPPGPLTRLGNTLYAIGAVFTPSTGSVRQGALERSNVDLALSMTELITRQRAMGLSSRALSIQEETLSDAVSMGRLRG